MHTVGLGVGTNSTRGASLDFPGRTVSKLKSFLLHSFSRRMGALICLVERIPGISSTCDPLLELLRFPILNSRSNTKNRNSNSRELRVGVLQPVEKKQFRSLVNIYRILATPALLPSPYPEEIKEEKMPDCARSNSLDSFNCTCCRGNLFRECIAGHAATNCFACPTRAKIQFQRSSTLPTSIPGFSKLQTVLIV